MAGGDSLRILAIEPFFAGSRRLMLETLMRRSRHQWTVLKLPGKRIERRLEASAQWFAEVILRRPTFSFDLIFCSEAINLPELFQLCPELGGRPVVVYFHDNQLPLPGRGVTRPIDHVNLLTAMEASEIWFNSLHHMRTFTGRAVAVLKQMPHYFDQDAMQRITSRSSLVVPPVEIDAVSDLEHVAGFKRNRRAIFMDLRGADTELLAKAVKVLQARKQQFELVTVGPRGHLPADLPRTTVAESDEDGATFAMSKCGTYVSTAVDTMFDPRAIMALASGMRTILPDIGVYPDMVHQGYHDSVLYQPHPDFLASAIQDAWALPELKGWSKELRQGVEAYEAEQVTNNIDGRLWSLATHFRAEHGAL